MKYIFLITLIFVSIAQATYAESIISIQLGNKTKILKLQNGEQVKLLSMGKFFFKNGDPPALVLKYETEKQLSDLDSLKSEVNEIWKIFQYDVKKSGLTTGAIRAQRPLEGTVIRKGQGYGFVFFKQPDGSWKMKE